MNKVMLKKEPNNIMNGFLDFIESEYNTHKYKIVIENKNKELKLFLEKYPLERLDKIKLEEYDQLNDQFTLMNMLENKTNNVGPGSLGNNSNKYFYHKKSDKKYHYKNLKGFNYAENDDINQNFEVYIKKVREYIEGFNRDNYNKNFRMLIFKGTSALRMKLIYLYCDNLLLTISKRDYLNKISIKLLEGSTPRDSILANFQLIDILSKQLNGTFFEKYPDKHIVSLCLLKYFLPKENPSELELDEQTYDKEDTEYLDISESLTEDDKNVKKRKVITYKTTNSKKKRTKRCNKQRAVAFLNSKYKCEIDESHKSFISNKTKRKYLESHHLIPLSAQDEFDYSLDNHTNIVTLCPECHRKIHHGKYIDKKEDLVKLFKIRFDNLIKSGLILSKSKTHPDIDYYLKYYQ